ncbi:MAG: amidohydrolase [Planctomycetia bacterium]|nr:amidohydrolase [Planctomycetia bacterium]
MRVDAHAHIWQPTARSAASIATLVSSETAIPPELLLEQMDEHGVDRAVLVQPVYPGEDNSYVADAAAENPERFIAVCVVDPRKPGAAGRLTYWVKERGCRGLRLRPRIAEEAEVFGDPSTWPLWRAAERLGIVVNVLASPEHLGKVAALAERFLAIPILIDHLAHPHLGGPGTEATAAGPLVALERFPNVHVKLSGFYYFSRGEYPYNDCRELLRAVCEAFGPKRLLWGSDFPHVLSKTGYGQSLQFAEHSLDWLAAADRLVILGENAVRLYWREP